jgi:hypothetical protein
MRRWLSRVLRSSPALYTAAHRTLLAVSAKTHMGRMLRRRACGRHARQSTVIAGPGFLGFQGGVYNPGAVRLDDGGICLLACGHPCHWRRAVGVNAHLALRGRPVRILLDRSLTVTGAAVVAYPGQDSRADQALEDFRLFRCRGEIWAVHGTLRVVREACKANYREARQTLARLDVRANALAFLGYPELDVPVQPLEKNWVFAERGGELFLFYAFHPYRVLRLEDPERLRFRTVMDRPLAGRLADIGGFGSRVSFSANPVEYDARHWLLVVHQIERQRWIDRCYHQWAVLLDKESLLPVKIIPRPLFESLGARGTPPGILYVMSVVPAGDDFHFFCGEGDAYVTRLTVPRAALAREWVDAG